jgi:hypothetical protein
MADYGAQLDSTKISFLPFPSRSTILSLSIFSLFYLRLGQVELRPSQLSLALRCSHMHLLLMFYRSTRDILRNYQIAQ